MAVAPHSFAARLKNLREERGLSKTKLGKNVGVSTTCVWNWEEGNTEPRPENLSSLAKVLGVSTSFLEFGPRVDQGHSVTEDQGDKKIIQLTLAEVIGDAKRRIALLAGIDPERVKISLDC